MEKEKARALLDTELTAGEGTARRDARCGEGGQGRGQ